MATRRRTAYWIQPPGEEKCRRKEARELKRGEQGAAEIILLLITAKGRSCRGKGGLTGFLKSRVQLLSQCRCSCR